MKAKSVGTRIMLLTRLSGLTHAELIDTAFTCHGRLQDGSTPAKGQYDFQFSLHDAATSFAERLGVR